MKQVLLTLAVATLAASPLAAAPSARSGQYDSLTLAVVDGTVTGTFFEQRGEAGPGGAPQFSCTFLLRGKLEGDRAKIDTWTPGDKERIAGELVFKGDEAMLKLMENQDGCGMTSGDMVHEYYKATRSQEGKGWIGVGMVSAKRAAFRPAPKARAPRKPYIVAYDPVVILECKGDWLRASYLGGDRPITGWLRRNELAAYGLPTGCGR
jgi:hypothetical protein